MAGRDEYGYGKMRGKDDGTGMDTRCIIQVGGVDYERVKYAL